MSEGLCKYLSASCGDRYTVTVFDTLDSTNIKARQLADTGAPEGTVVIACSQQRGRGRFGRDFYSPEGTGLYMSVILRPRIPVERALYITTAAAVAVAETAEELTGSPAQIKWVNDVYCRGKKVCGILTEGQMEGDRLCYAVLGIGVNIAPPEGGFPVELANKAGALFDTPVCVHDRLAAGILGRFDRYYRGLEQKAFLEGYRRRSMLDGKQVYLLAPDGTPTERVTVQGVDEEFALVVRDKEGIRRLSSGDVSITL